VSAGRERSPLHRPHRRTKSSAARPLRLVTAADATARNESEATPAGGSPALAVWRLARSSSRLLPSELARRLIAHYSEPGDLVLGAADALRQAERLGRRVLPTNARAITASAGRVIALRPDERAALAIAALNAPASERRAAELAAQLGARLNPGAFLVLAPVDARGRLGAIVHACQQHGLQYWQHVVVLHPGGLEPERVAAEGVGCRSLRCHRDLLIFRRPAATDALASEAAAVAKVAA
jgi:hypothetical protein